MIMMVSRLFDGISDIVMGFIVDKTKSKHGKARPWLLWLALPIAISLVLMFAVPNLGDTGKYIYVAITYNLVTTVLYTAINIPYGAMTALMTRDQDQRMSINVFRMLMAQIGSLLINAFTLPIVDALGGTGNQKAWVIASVLYGILAAVLFLVCFYKTEERVHVVDENNDTQLSFGKSLKICMKNDQWLVIVAFWVIMAFGMGTSMSAGTYYAKYALGNEEFAGFLAAISIVPVLVIMPFLPILTQKYGKTKVAILGGAIQAIGAVMVTFNPTDTTWLIITGIIKGVGSSATMGTIFAMVADTIEYGHWKTGVRTEGMLYSSTTFGAKVGAGVGAAIGMSLLSSAGYDGLAAVQNAGVMNILHVLYVLVPIVYSVALPLLLLVFYKMDKIYPQVISELEEREANQSK